MILLVGATGTVGSKVARLLAGRDDVRALARSDAAAAALAEQGVAVVRGDLADPETLREPFAGAARVLLITPFSPEQAALERNALDAAEAAGAELVVKLSVIDAAPGVEVAMTRAHREIELDLRERGLPHVVLRADWFASNVASQIALIRGGVLTYPYADAATAPIDPADIAEVAALALTRDEPVAELLELTGPERLTFRETAARIAAVTGRPLQLLAAEPEDWRAGLVAFGIPDWQANALLELIEGYSRRTDDPVRDGVQQALGRPPRSFDTWVRDELTL